MRRLISALSIATLTLSAFGWGQKGHDTVAYIAEKNLTPTALAAVEEILDGKSMVYYANWPDNACYTEPYAYTKTWHYKNIDADETYESAPNIETGNIVTALDEQIQVLKNPSATKDEKWLALVLTAHFLGDIHQPLHMGRATDRGGNNHLVRFFGDATNLHTVWDSKLPEAGHRWSYTEWEQNLNRATDEEKAAILKDGTPYSWGKESYEACCKVYDATPAGTNISYDYIAEWTPLVEQQFLKGGLRLADLLNGIFDPSYTPLNGIK